MGLSDDKKEYKRKLAEKIEALQLIDIGGIQHRCAVKRVILSRSGEEYSGYAVSVQKREEEKWVDASDGKKWAIYALGLNETALDFMEKFSSHWIPGTTAFFIDGPGSGLSKGRGACYQMGASFTAAVQCVERQGATHVILSGYSMGEWPSLKGSNNTNLIERCVTLSNLIATTMS